MYRRQQRGFNLIEVLVALVVLSLGLLGIAGLQISSVRNTQGSYYRSLATVFMNDLAERVYANTPGVLSYGTYNSGTAGCVVPANICARESTTGTAPAACTAAQMATYDLFSVACGMPNGTGRLGGVVNSLPGGALTTNCGACTATSPITITVSWTDQGSSGTTNAQSMLAGANQQASLVIQP